MSNFMPEPAIFQVDITSRFGPEYVPMLHDLARFTVIQIGIQVMLYTMDSDRFAILSADFAVLLLFIMVGVLFYWLVFKRVIDFK